MTTDSVEDASDTEFRVYEGPAKLENLKGDLRDLFAYWEDLRGEAFAPSWKSFDWAAVPSDLVRWCAVVDVHEDPLDFTYRFWGTGRRAMQKADYTGRSVKDFRPRKIADKAFREYRMVVRIRAALCLETVGLHSARSEPFDYQFLRLPFSDDGTRVDNILGVGLYDPSVIEKAFDFYGSDVFLATRPF